MQLSSEQKNCRACIQQKATTPGFTLEKDTGLIFWDVSVPARGEAKILLPTKTEKK